MRIRQVRVAEDIAKFGPHFREKFELVPYHDRYAPAIFYGCYRREDAEAIRDHRSIAVLLWGGSDAMVLRQIRFVQALRRDRLSPIYHIAPSSFIAEDLDRAGLEFFRYNVFPKPEELFEPVPLGNKVYVYAASPKRYHREFYGLTKLPEIQRHFPSTEFIVQYSSPPTVPYEQMPAIYRECAVGLRLVPHDAGSCTVVELALMGRYTVWNGYFPGAIPFETVQDAIAALRLQLNRAGEINTGLSERARKAISDRGWLHTESYLAGLNKGMP